MQLHRFMPHHSPAVRLPACPQEVTGNSVDVPGYLQSRSYTCGFASTLMVVRTYDPEANALELYQQLGTDRGGTRQTAIVRELRRRGVRANVRYDVSFSRLCAEIERGKVVIGYLFDDEHWLVIYGYTRNPDRVFVADPRPGEPCLHSWSEYGHRLGRFGIVCSAPRYGTEQAPNTAPDCAEPPRQLSLPLSVAG